MRAAFILVLIAGACLAQVYNAADAGVGSSTTVLAPGARAFVSYFSSSGAPGNSAGVSLLPVNSTTPYPAQVLSQTASEITFVVPNNMPLGPAQIIYKPAGQATRWTSATIVPSSLSLYRTGPVGPLIAPIVDLRGSGVASGLTRPAQPGFGVELFASGLGATPPSQVQVTLGGVPQQVSYVGAPPQFPGINQINFIVAPGTPDGCYVPLVLTYGTQSFSSFLSKTSDGKPCHHPWGLPTQVLTTLDNGNAVETLDVLLATGIVAATSDRASRQESAQVLLTEMNAGQIASSFVGTAAAAQPCSRISLRGVAFSGFEGSLPGGQLTNAAGTLTLPYTSPPAPDSALSSLPKPVIGPGPWTFNSSGGLPPLMFQFTLPPPIQLSGSSPIVINRAQNPTITWNGSGYDAFATLQLTLQSAFAPGVSCTMPAAAGSVTIQANLLAQFSAGTSGVITATVNESGPGIPAASGLVLGLALWSSTDTRPVDFQ